jgi:hypothetical protein
MRKPIPVYCYHHKEFICKAPSIQDASKMTNTSSPMIQRVLRGKLEVTRDGWVFTKEELTSEEMEHMPDSYLDKFRVKRDSTGCKKEVENQSYEVACKDGKVFDMPNSREARKAMLRHIITLKMRERWSLLPASIATMERHLIRELIDSL